jgi:hypothetical protein
MSSRRQGVTETWTPEVAYAFNKVLMVALDVSDDEEWMLGQAFRHTRHYCAEKDPRLASLPTAAVEHQCADEYIHCGVFLCVGCNRWMPYCWGATDAQPCDDCVTSDPKYSENYSDPPGGEP